MTKHIFFVRHGESEMGAKRIWQLPECPLSAKGIQQAKFIAERCTSLKAQVLLSSTMARARQTADEISRVTELPVIESPELHEILRPLVLRGIPQSDPLTLTIEKEVKDHWKDPNWHHGGEENFLDITARAGRALADLAARPEERIIVATHGFFMRTMLAEMIFGRGNYDRDTLYAFHHVFRTSNTGLTYCTVNAAGNWVVMTWNDFAHLGDEKVI